MSIFSVLVSTLLLSSCSQLLAYRDEGEMNAANTTAGANQESVPRAQYDELARKYQELLNKSKNLKTVEENNAVSVSELPSNINDGATKPMLGAESTNLDPSELVNKLDSTFPDKKTEVTLVDAPPAAPTSLGVQEVYYSDEVDEQIKQLREVGNLVRVNKFEDALAILKNLENSKEKQIQVRAKMMLGDLLFNQGEYDLSMQVYEEVINKYAFSGLVLKALGKLVACSEKLKQPEKQAKYYSLLHDFFEAG